jgi:hypothetical protein
MKKYVPTQQEVDTVLKLYNEELLGSHTISLKIGLNKQIVLRILRENGINLGPSGRRYLGGKEVASKRYESKEETKDKKRNIHKIWSENNRDYLNSYHKLWREKNIEKYRENKRNYEKTRKAKDPIYKLINNFRTAIYQVLKENNVQKNGHYFEILKYKPDELISHLEKQFIDGMNWENYGQWHVDHIRPISSFKITEIGDDEFMKCWSLGNLQPLWGIDNIKKSNNL